MKKGFFLSMCCFSTTLFAQQEPNIILIYADDLGYGDLSCYGNKNFNTPNIDKLASNGIRFTDCHSAASTSTPSRFSLMTGIHAFRVKGTGVARGDEKLLIPTDRITMPKVFQKAGYSTAAIGKWHLGLGNERGKQDWNDIVSPGPSDIGFDYSFIIPATGDRVPCVFMENHRVVGLDQSDSIFVSYDKPFEGEPIAKYNRDKLILQHNEGGHDQALINGVGRIGYMKGGKNALWEDDKISLVLVEKAEKYIKSHKNNPFFMYFSTHNIHVPRLTNARFVDKSGMGPRGDSVLELDWMVGKIVDCLEDNNLLDNTLIIFSSDNGGVVDDGYQDRAKELLDGHKVSGNLRGFKGATWEGGTRVPTIVSWSGHITKGEVSDARLAQIDLLRSFASFLNVEISETEAEDSFDFMNTWLGESKKGRPWLIEENHQLILSLLVGDWKYIEPKPERLKSNDYYGTTFGDKLFNLKNDLSEKNNLEKKYPQRLELMKKALKKLRVQHSLTDLECSNIIKD